MKFSALNVNFNGSRLDFLGSRKPAHKGIKEQYPRKSRYFTVVTQSFVKRLQIGMGMLPITTALSDELFSHINFDEFERHFRNKEFLLIRDLRLQCRLQENEHCLRLS